jgi:ArsR family transcriptional regulator
MEKLMGDPNMEGARIFKAFCDENRMSILDQLRGGEKCACILLEKLNIAQSTLSHHMKILCESGIVASRQEGKWTYYSLSAGGCERARNLLTRITTPSMASGCEGGCSCS